MLLLVVALIEGLEARTARSNELFLQWRQARLDENARRKALNEVAKTRIDFWKSKISRKEVTPLIR